MPQIRRLQEYVTWIEALRDARAVAKITVRVDRLGMGNAGDVEAVGEGVSEMKIHYGPGYRVYFKRSGMDMVVLLCGGDKSTQSNDISEAKALAKSISS